MRRHKQPVMTTTEEPVNVLERKLSYYIGNLQGVGARERQEDSFAFSNAADTEAMRQNGMLFVMCDGMGGMKDGKLASETATAHIRRAFAAMDRGGDIAMQLKRSVFTASQEVSAIIGGDGGCTVVAGIIYDDRLYYACVGDSFLYLMRKGQIYKLNAEHTVRTDIYLECVREGDFSPRSGREDPESAALTQFLGMVGLSRIDCSVRGLPIRDGDVFLACSDGVGAVLKEQQILNALFMGEPKTMCEILEREIISCNRADQDNYTALIVKCLR